ncbi:glycoprotein 3-alpha-L-fucosyltransferase A-like [Haliotis asinina]|uniref:glycoprotein 3-alpha-L-fucosyltransferase A-like n=1 Tax=Haliotis asinina TaxID=109174 RepID=UPI0035320BEE
MKIIPLVWGKYRKHNIYITAFFAVATFVLSFREIARLEQIQTRKLANQIVPFEAEFPEGGKNPFLRGGDSFRKQWIERKLKESFDDIVTEASYERSSGYKKANLTVKEVTTMASSSPKRLKDVVWFNAPAWIQRQKGSELFGGCKYKMCTLSYDHRDLAKADVVLVDGFNLHKGAPPPRSPTQMFALFSFEPPTYLKIPSEWKDAFNWTITYRPDSDVWRPYGIVRKRPSGLKGKNYDKLVKEKTNSVAWFVSRCVSHSQREKYVQELERYIDIDVFGKCGDTKCGRDCYEKLKSYKFFLAFENSFCENYVTEKFFKTFLHDVVPVVRGGPDYKNLFGGGYIIDSKDFANIRELGYHLNFLLNNDKAYIELLKEKDKFKAYFPLPWCGLCEKVHKPLFEQRYADINQWLAKEKCYSPSDLRT